MRVTASVAVIAVVMGGVGCSAGSPSTAEFEAQAARLQALETAAQAQAAQLAELARLEAEKARAADVYTRSDVDGLLAAPKPWSLAIPVEPAAPFGESTRLSAPAESFFQGRFTLPDTYVSGTRFELRVAWAKSEALVAPCVFEITKMLPILHRAGRPSTAVDMRFRENQSVHTLLIPAPADASIQTLVLDFLVIYDDRGPLQPGDRIDVAFYRFAGNPQSDDTCSGPNGDFRVLGMSLHSKAP